MTAAIRLRVIAFALVTAAALTFTGIRYVGLADRPMLVQADFAEAAGVAERAPVTYRGVPVGQVGELRLTPDGVRAELRLDRGVRVPVSTDAVVANRSIAGDAYIDLRPRSADGPFLTGGSTIPRGHTRTPVAAETVLTSAGDLVGSIRPDDLATVIDELALTFDGTGPAIARILDNQATVTDAAIGSLPQTAQLLRDSRTALGTQADQAGAIREWSRSLASLSGQLAASEPDLRRLLSTGTTASRDLTAILDDVQPDLGVLLGNLIITGQVQARRVDGIQQILATYPAVVAQGRTFVPGDGTAHLGLVLAEADAGAGPCGTACGTTTAGGDSGPVPLGPRTPAGATAPAETVSQPTRFAGFDPQTGLALGPDGSPLTLGSTGGQQQLVGEQSWKSLLLGPLAR